jgi:hypothetical protein
MVQVEGAVRASHVGESREVLTLVDPFPPHAMRQDGVERLRALCARAVVLGGVSGASWLVVRHGALALVCADSEHLLDLERVQAEFRVGPGVTAQRTGNPVLLTSALDRGGEWPAWASTARRLGLQSAAALPFVQGDQVTGVLGLYQLAPGPIKFLSVYPILRELGTSLPAHHQH